MGLWSDLSPRTSELSIIPLTFSRLSQKSSMDGLGFVFSLCTSRTVLRLVKSSESHRLHHQALLPLSSTCSLPFHPIIELDGRCMDGRMGRSVLQQVSPLAQAARKLALQSSTAPQCSPSSFLSPFTGSSEAAGLHGSSNKVLERFFNQDTQISVALSEYVDPPSGVHGARRRQPVSSPLSKHTSVALTTCTPPLPAVMG